MVWTYCHEALFYSGGEEFLSQTLPFLREGISREEPTLVVVNGEKMAVLREGLGAGADAVTFADMEQVGVNPARIISFWDSFIRQHAGTGTNLRGIGEPMWAARTADEMTECHQHEAV
jgi:MEDS: MEthanogen/methylotroph, DcmR Sensory domain